MNRFEPKMRELHATLRGFESGAQPIRLTEEEIQQAEALIEAGLPEDYREFIRDFGKFDLNALYPIREGRMDGASIGEFSELPKITLNYLSRDTGWWPENNLCIGICGNLPTFLCFQGENRGKVSVKDYDDLWLVADSFAEFMDLLTFEFEDDEHEKPCVIEDAALFWATFSTE